MRTGFLIKRDTYLRVFGALIAKSLEKGNSVVVFFVPNSVQGSKGYQTVSNQTFQSLSHLKMQIVNTQIHDLYENCRKHKVDILITLEGFHTLQADLENLNRLRQNGIKVVSLCHFFEIANQPLIALDYFDKTYYISNFLLDLHFSVNLSRNQIDQAKRERRQQYEIVGSPLFDPYSPRDMPSRGSYGIPSGVQVVLLIAPVISHATPWRFFVWRSRGKLKRTKEILKAHKWDFLYDSWMGETFFDLVRGIREFCDRQGCYFVVKSRGKQQDPKYLRLFSDLYIDGSDDVYYPLSTTRGLLSLSELCISVNSMATTEAVAMGVPALNIAVPHLDVLGNQKETKYLDQLLNPSRIGPFNYPGCVFAIPWRRAGSAIRTLSVTGTRINESYRQTYLKDFLGIRDRSSSIRILESLETL